MNHPGALGDAGHCHRNAVDCDAPRRALGHGVGRHHRSRGPVPTRSPRCGLRDGQARDDAFHRQRLHDDAGGKRQDLLGSAAEELRHPAARRASIGKTRVAGARIRVACIDDERAEIEALRVLAREMLAADRDRRGAEAVLGEDAGDRRALGEPHHQQVFAVGLAHAGHGDAEVDAGNGV